MIATSILHFLWCKILVNYFGLELIGAGIATFITYFLNFFLTTFYCTTTSNREIRASFFMPTRASLRQMSTYLRVAIPSLTMLCLEWWSFEVLAFMAGRISLEATAAHVVVLNTHVVIIMIPLGSQVACTVLVG
jgi:multidrug resistance protein, MATE family